MKNRDMNKGGIWPVVTESKVLGFYKTEAEARDALKNLAGARHIIKIHVPKKSLANQIIDWDRNSKTVKALDAWVTAGLWVVVTAIIITLGIKILMVNL